MNKKIKAGIYMAIVMITLVGLALIIRNANKEYVDDSYPLKYENEVNAASAKYGIDKALIYGIIKTESNFDAEAESNAGALGLMQLMPSSFEWLQTFYKEENDYEFEDLKDPALNIDYGVELLAILSEMYEVEDTMICAYNGGLGNVDSWLQNPEYSDDGKHLKAVPFPETDNYRKLVAQNKSIYKKLYFSLERD